MKKTLGGTLGRTHGGGAAKIKTWELEGVGRCAAGGWAVGR